MIIYEVNLEVNADIYAEYYEWLLEHVKQILNFKGFVSAEIGKIQTEDGSHQLRVNYCLASEEYLQDYLKNHSPAMRAEAAEKFGDQFRAHRRIIEVLN